MAPVFFVSHGTALHTLDPKDPTRLALAKAGALSMEGIKAIISISAHDISSSGCRVVSTDASFRTIHDHPASAWYGYNYAGAKGSKTYGQIVIDTLQSAGIPTTESDPAESSGLDHGAWLALGSLFPKADFPIIPVSLHASFDPAWHLALGRALLTLRNAGFAIVLSGSVTHNQDEFRRTFLSSAALESINDITEKGCKSRREACLNAPVAPWSSSFDAWVSAVVTLEVGSAREQHLAGYKSRADAEKAHPEPSHYIPLLVAAGAAGDTPGKTIHSGCFQYSLSMTSFLFH